MKGTAAGLAFLAALPGIGKFFKPAAKAVSKAAKVAKFGDGEPKYLADLIAVVKAKGKSSVGGYQDTISVHRYKGVEVTEEAGGITKIKHEKEFDVGHEYPGYRENQMQIETVDVKGGKSTIYDEGTLRPDPNDPGKFVDDMDAIS